MLTNVNKLLQLTTSIANGVTTVYQLGQRLEMILFRMADGRMAGWAEVRIMLLSQLGLGLG